MALEITYWTKSGNRNLARNAISSETVTLSGTSAQSAATPTGCAYVSLLATETMRYAYNDNPTATATAGSSGHKLASGERIWVDAVAGNKFAGIQAS